MTLSHIPARTADAPPSRWPVRLWIVRHGESAGNVADALARRRDAPRVDIGQRDVDVPLSARGRQQARALGEWFAELDERPSVVLTSPYVRAVETARAVERAGGLASPDVARCVDERLRER